MTLSWNSDQELFSLMRKDLFTAVVGDIMDRMTLYHHFLPPEIRPLDEAMVVVGRAMTVLETDIEPGTQPSGKPFGMMLEALDDLKPGEIYVATGASSAYALWGGLMSNRAMKLGAAGAVLDGYSRDTREILSLGFPVFSHGSYARDQSPRGEVVDFRVDITVGQVRISSGDLIFGDRDGVIVVPHQIEREVIVNAFEKATGENMVRKKILEGMSSVDAFAKYGVM